MPIAPIRASLLRAGRPAWKAAKTCYIATRATAPSKMSVKRQACGALWAPMRLVGWGISFIDIDNGGWLDILVAKGHVYPEVDGTQVDAAYAERKYLYRNLRNCQFEDISLTGGPGIMRDAKARGFAIGDYDND